MVFIHQSGVDQHRTSFSSPDAREMDQKFNYRDHKMHLYDTPGFGVTQVVLYNRHAFATSHKIVKLGYDTNEYYTLGLEVLDKQG